MKYVIYLCCSLFLSMFFIRCKKDTADKKSISGSWELRQVVSSRSTTYASGNGNILKFSGSTYEQYTNGALSKKGRFALISDKTVQEDVCLVIKDDQYKNRIVFDGNYDTTKTFVNVKNDELRLISGCFANDAGISLLYQRE